MLGSANMDDQSLWPFIEQLLSGPAGTNRMPRTSQPQKNLRNDTRDYVRALNKKNRLMELPPSLRINFNAMYPEDAFRIKNAPKTDAPALSEQHRVRAFARDYPGSFGRLVNSLPEGDAERKQLWEHYFGPNATGNMRSDRSHGRTIGARRESYFGNLTDIPKIPEERGFTYNPKTTVDALQNESHDLRWSLIPDAYRQVLAGRQKMAKNPLLAGLLTPPNPKPAAPAKPRELSKPDWRNSATQNLYNSEKDQTKLLLDLMNLDQPFHPLVSAGMVRNRFGADVPNANELNARRQRQNEEVIKNRQVARTEAVPWTPDARNASDKPPASRMFNSYSDYEQTLFDPRAMMSGFTNDNMMMPERGSFNTADEIKQWRASIDPFLSKEDRIAAETQAIDPDRARRLHEERMRKDPKYKREVESKAAWEALMLEEDMRKKRNNTDGGNPLKTILGIGGLGAFTADSLSRQQRQGGRR